MVIHLFCPSYIIYHYEDGSIGAGGVGRPGEEVNCDHSLMIEDEFLNGSAHPGSISFGNSLQFGVVNSAVHHLSMPDAGNTPQAVPPLEQVRHELIDIETTVKLDLVQLEIVAVLESIA